MSQAQYIARLVVVLCVFVGSTACSAASMIYAQMPRIVASRLDDAFDLRPSQKHALKDELNRMLQWHRRDQIPRLLDWLDRVEANMASDGGFDANEVQDLTTSLMGFRDAIADHVYARAYGFLKSLSPEQINRFAEGQAKRNNARFKELNKTPEEYQKWRARGWVSRWKEWVGPLNEQQNQLVQTSAQQAHRLDSQQRDRVFELQEDFLELLRGLPPSEPEDFVATLWKLTPPSAGAERYDHIVTMIAPVATSLTDEQKEHLRDEIDVWRKRLRGVLEHPAQASN
jgi:hypothetical protein